MKKILLLTMAVCAGLFFSCKQDEDDNNSDKFNITVTLPADVGTDSFAGKTFYDDEIRYVFNSDKTFTAYNCGSEDENHQHRNATCQDWTAYETYKYSYNAEKNLIFYQVIEKNTFLIAQSFNDIKETYKEIFNLISSEEKFVAYAMEKYNLSNEKAEETYEELADFLTAAQTTYELFAETMFCFFNAKNCAQLVVTGTDFIQFSPFYSKTLSLKELFDNYEIPSLYEETEPSESDDDFSLQIFNSTLCLCNDDAENEEDSYIASGFITSVSDTKITLKEYNEYEMCTGKTIILDYTYDPSTYNISITYEGKTYNFKTIGD